MKKLRRIAAFAAALVLALALNISVLASSVVSISDARTGVIQVELKYVDQAGNEHPIKSGTAFLIDEQYAITNYHVVHMTQDEKAQATENFNVDFVNTTVSGLKIFVVVRRDMTIEVTEVNGSAESDFTILKLSQALKDRTYLPLGTSSDISEAETVYALGFPGLADAFTDAQYYTSDDVNITSGIVNKKIVDSGVPYIQHSAELSGGNSGGPLLNEDGIVVGVNRSNITYENDNSVVYNRSIDISEIRTYLDSLGIPYQDAAELSQPAIDDTTPTPTQPTESIEPTGNVDDEQPVAVDKTSLQKAIDQVKNVPTDEYTADSVKTMNDALRDAEKVNDDANATQEEVDDAEADLRNAIRNLEEKEFPIVLVAVIGGVVLLVIVIVIVMVAASSSKKKKKAAEAERLRREETMRQQTVAPVQRPQGQMPPQMPRPQPQPNPVNRPYTPSPMGAPAEGAGETSVLNNGAGETTVLGGQGRPTAALSRIKTGETVSIAKQVFTIGKERRKVDFCISDNTSVSREHAQIICRGMDYYVVDKNSTNFTFVNGNKIQAGQEILLKNGDKIKLADEEFVFKMS